MNECIEDIIMKIPIGFFFDSHYIINRLIVDFSDQYLNFCSNYTGFNITLTSHQQIGHVIASFEGDIVERQQAQSWSVNIHNNGSECALWKRI